MLRMLVLDATADAGIAGCWMQTPMLRIRVLDATSDAGNNLLDANGDAGNAGTGYERRY